MGKDYVGTGRTLPDMPTTRAPGSDLSAERASDRARIMPGISGTFTSEANARDCVAQFLVGVAIMSFQAMAWAADKQWGGCSGRAAIYAIANHASTDYWFCYAAQETLARESEQSIDSIGRRIAEFVKLGEIRRIKLKRFGRRTFDFLILKPSPLFTAALSEIEPFVPKGCDIIGDDDPGDATAACGSVENDANNTQPIEAQSEAETENESHATAACGSVESPTLPQPAVHATALVRQQEPVLEPKKDNPPNPPSGGGLEIPKGKQKSFDEFVAVYPIPIPQYEKVFRLWIEMPDAENAEAIRGARGYAAFLIDLKRQGRNRNIRDALRWLREREWRGYLPKAEKLIEAAQRFEAAEGSPQWNAWEVFYRCCGFSGIEAAIPHRVIRGGRRPIASLPSEQPPLVGNSDTKWVTVAEGTGPFAAWMRRLREVDGVKIVTRNRVVDGKMRTVLIVPSEWPPAKSSSTGPPESPKLGELSDEDARVLAGAMGV